ncbi:hypothetical protein Hdeb2414_s0001g00010771 [Helianthus debilis subsp. tardiflorus]
MNKVLQLSSLIEKMSNQPNKNEEKPFQILLEEIKKTQILLEAIKKEISEDGKQNNKLFDQEMRRLQEKRMRLVSKRRKIVSEKAALEEKLDEIEADKCELEREFNNLASAPFTRNTP